MASDTPADATPLQVATGRETSGTPMYLNDAADAYQAGLAAGRAEEREACARLVLSDDAVAAAAAASDEWFGKDGDLKFGASEMSKAQARVELAALADLIRARNTETPDHA